MKLEVNVLVFVISRKCWGVVTSTSPLVVETCGQAGRIGVEQNDLLITYCMCPEGQKSPNFPKSDPVGRTMTSLAIRACEAQSTIKKFWRTRRPRARKNTRSKASRTIDGTDVTGLEG